MAVSAPTTEAATAPRARFDALDVARGLAIAAMIVYHAVWDLQHFGFIAPGATRATGFILFGHTIACAFLAIAGASHALATRRRLALRAFGWRWGRVALAAAAVTIVTLYTQPDSAVWFGILHCIAAALLLALLLTRAPLALVIAVAAAIILAPFILASPRFDATNAWLGLGLAEPNTNDWRPIAPWAGVTLLGFALMRAAAPRLLSSTWAHWRAANPIARAIAFAGRHSLAIYLLHQPILFGAAMLAAQALQIDPARQQEPAFVEACESACAQIAQCRTFCACVVTQSKAQGLWREALANTLSAENRVRYDGVVDLCRRRIAP